MQGVRSVILHKPDKPPIPIRYFTYKYNKELIDRGQNGSGMNHRSIKNSNHAVAWVILRCSFQVFFVLGAAARCGDPSYLTEDKLLSLTCNLMGLFLQTSELRVVVGNTYIRVFASAGLTLKRGLLEQMVLT